MTHGRAALSRHPPDCIVNADVEGSDEGSSRHQTAAVANIAARSGFLDGMVSVGPAQRRQNVDRAQPRDPF